MNKSPTFRYVELKVGVFIAVTVVLLGVGLFLLGRAHNWFIETLRLEATLTDLPPDSVPGIAPGAEVKIFGAVAGLVTDVAFEAVAGARISYRLHIHLQVRGDFIPLVRTDSEALVKRTLGLGGGAFVQITAGSGARVKDGAQLPCRIAPDMATLVENILEGLRSEEGHLQGMLRNARLAMGNLVEITDRLLHGDGVFRKLIKDDKTSSQFDRALAKINSGLDQIAQVLDSTGQRLSQTQGALQDLQTLAANTNQTVSGELPNIRDFVKQTRQTVKRVDATLLEVREIVAVLRSQSDQVPGLLLQTQELLRQTTRTIESLQETWLLRDYVAPDEALRLSPADLTEP
jgi:phospholipid/cholesterol/gamma-HCH transport system substrate-binding protein